MGVNRGELSRPEASDVFDLIPNLNFPAFMSLLAVGASDDDHKSKERGFDLEQAAIKAAIDQLPTPVKPEEAKQVINSSLNRAI